MNKKYIDKKHLLKWMKEARKSDNYIWFTKPHPEFDDKGECIAINKITNEVVEVI